MIRRHVLTNEVELDFDTDSILSIYREVRATSKSVLPLSLISSSIDSKANAVSAHTHGDIDVSRKAGGGGM